MFKYFIAFFVFFSLSVFSQEEGTKTKYEVGAVSSLFNFGVLNNDLHSLSGIYYYRKFKKHHIGLEYASSYSYKNASSKKITAFPNSLTVNVSSLRFKYAFSFFNTKRFSSRVGVSIPIMGYLDTKLISTINGITVLNEQNTFGFFFDGGLSYNLFLDLNYRIYKNLNIILQGSVVLPTSLSIGVGYDF